MRKPKAVQIMGHWFAVEFCDDDIEIDGLLCEGALYFDKRMIEIKNDVNWKLHLLHECLHASLSMSGVGEVLGPQNEEAVVRAVEHALGPIITFEPKRNRFKF